MVTQITCSQMRQISPETITNFWLKQYILLGYAAKGTVYLSIGILAVQAAIFNRQAAGTYLSLSSLADRPFGRLLVLCLAIALGGYVLRRLLQTIFLPGYDRPSSWKCRGKRIGYFVSGLSYAGVISTAVSLAFNSGEHDDTIEDLASQLFEQPIGEWLIFLGGISAITVGIFYVYGAYIGSYISEFDSDELHHRWETWFKRFGKIGVAARGISFILTGLFLIQAALLGNSQLAGGLQNAFQLLALQPLGSLWLGLIGIGFICYGLYMYAATFYRRYAIR